MPQVILPVLNEADALPWVLERMPLGYEPLVVDNGSTDGSPEIAAALGAAVVAEPLRGFGAACFAGLAAATDDIVCFMDCDASLDPRDLPRVAAPILEGRLDLVIGSETPHRVPGPYTPAWRTACSPWRLAGAPGWPFVTSARCGRPDGSRCSRLASGTGGSAGLWRWSCGRERLGGASMGSRSPTLPVRVGRR